MTVVKVGENENIESAIKRFKRKCQKDGIIGDIRKEDLNVNVLCLASCLKLEKESTMISQALDVRKKLKQQENVLEKEVKIKSLV